MDQGQTTGAPAAQSQSFQDPAYHPENIAGRTADPPESSGGTGHYTRPPFSIRNLVSPSHAHTGLPAHPQNPSNLDYIVPVEDPVFHPGNAAGSPESNGATGYYTRPTFSIWNLFSLFRARPAYPQNASSLDQNRHRHHPHGRQTMADRIQPTIDNAIEERDKFARQALWSKWALNIAIGLQVTLGALTTGLAAAIKSAHQAQVSTAILGGLATLVASYMARVRGSGEPELSITRVKDLEQFLRECDAFTLDHGYEYGTPKDDLHHRLEYLRGRFEELLGNADGQRKLSSVGITATNATTGGTTTNVTNKSAV